MTPINNMGLGRIRIWPNYAALATYTFCCFFEVSGSTGLMPLAVITDFCDTWDLDGNGDIMPEVVPLQSGCWDIDSNGDIMPEAV